VKDEKQTKSAIAIFLGKNEKAKKQYLDLVSKPDGLVALLAKAD
jgi:hypothetical protein